jgi:hypothetical protein
LERLGIAEKPAKPLSASKIEGEDIDHVLLMATYWG